MERDKGSAAHPSACSCPVCFKEFRTQHEELRGTFRRTIAIGAASATLALSGVAYAGYQAYDVVSDAMERAICWQQSMVVSSLTGSSEIDTC